MHELLAILSAGLDAETRTTLSKRAEGLMRGIRYEAEIQSSVYRAALDAGWSLGRLDAICTLNAFYQIVLGPLAAASRPDLRVGLIRDIPVAYGTKVRITETTAYQLRECHEIFIAIVQHLGVDLWCLQSARANDLLYALGHSRSPNA